MFDHPAASCMDVAAFNDVAIHFLARPRSADELRSSYIDVEQWAETADWPTLHHDYLNLFSHYLHDDDTLKWREDRKRRLSRGRR
jgi:hypothetical protein